MIQVTIFNTEKELSKLTDLNHEELWDKGFNLDDWDWGICINLEDMEKFESRQRLLVSAMCNYCAGCEKIQYGFKVFYMVYHA